MGMYYYSDGTPNPVGPVSNDELRRMRAAGTILPGTPVIAEGETEWKTYDALIGSAASAVPPGPPVFGAPPPPVALQKPVERFYYADTTNQSVGPVTRDELVALKKRGAVHNDTPVIPVGDSTWGTYLSVIGPFGAGSIEESIGENTAKVRLFMRNPVWFVAAYIVLMLPTYILPYLGSNSMVARAGCVIADSVSPFAVGQTHSCTFLNVMLFFHVAFMAALVFVSYARGASIGKKWIVIFPIMAAFFDLMPGFSTIPLAPTVLHTVAIILGVATTQAVARAS